MSIRLKMSKTNDETEYFDIDVRYDKDKYKKINTKLILDRKENLHQFYTGIYFEKCYHNTGIYKWHYGMQQYLYEGKLYANDLHGYGILIYPDNSSYEGLFSHNKRFGPGVLTYPGGQQDVGFWDSKYLIRLSQNVNLEDKCLENIPLLAKSVEGKLFMLKYKKIVPIANEYDPVTELIKKFQLRGDESEQLYSKCIRNYKSIFMNHSVFNKNFYTDPEELDVDVIDHFDENEEPVVNTIKATNLLAWNNEKQYIEIMKHTFLNRKYEKILSYKIRNAFLPNRRDTFMNEGPIEEMCLKLLIACRDNDTETISKLITEYDIHPDVSDCFGNTTIIYAALTNKRDAIITLANLGANVNAINDECISAVMLCILHYIAIYKQILPDNWEDSLLNTDYDMFEKVDGRMWPTGSNSNSSVSFSSDLKETSSSKSDSIPNNEKKTAMKAKKLSKINKRYIFKLIYEAIPRPTFATRLANVRKQLKLSRIYRKSIKCDRMRSLNNIIKTIKTLIKCGANVNSCSVPYPPIISALFSDSPEMIQLILENNAEVNLKTIADSGGINPLHIICGMEKSENLEKVLSLLIKYGADVNARSNILHWLLERDKILAGAPLDYSSFDMGKTPFHVLAMSYDFDNENEARILNMAKILLEHGADPNEQYLGHNVLTLAALRGNVALMEYLLKNRICDPNANLGYNMGVPLTMLTLPKYSKNLTASKLKAMFEILVENNANPFMELFNYDGNALEYAIAVNKENKSKSSKNTAIKLLRHASGFFLRRYIDSQALQLIYNNFISKKISKSIISNVVKYLNVEKAQKILQILTDYNKIDPNLGLYIKLLTFVNLHTGKTKIQIQIINKTNTGRIDNNHLKTSNATNILLIIKDKHKNYELDLCKEEHVFNPYSSEIPEIDEDHEKYKVCYGCLERIDKNLQLCPYCTLVYFCSEECNIMKIASGEHPCQKQFYDTNVRSILSAFDLQDSENELPSYDSDSSSSEKSTKKKKKLKQKGTGKRGRGRERMERSEWEGGRRSWKGRRRSIGRSRSARRRKRRELFEMQQYLSKSAIMLRRFKKVSTSECTGKLISIKFKESLTEIKRQLRQKYKRPEIEHLSRNVWSKKLNYKLPVNRKGIKMLHKAKRINLRLVPVLDSDTSIDHCDPFDFKFWQLFLPYCVIQNGELFYRRNDNDLLYKFPYILN